MLRPSQFADVQVNAALALAKKVGMPPREVAARIVAALDVDGGYGIGSAAPLEGGVQPLGHDVKASRDGSTFLVPGDEGYDDAQADVWFYNEESARRAGFQRPGE